jgi:hypothetical protein
MKTKTALLITMTLAAALAAGTANAHGKHARHSYDRHPRVHYHPAPLRSKHMPRWLRDDRRFRHWYRRSAVRHNPYLPWWKVYRVYERKVLWRQAYRPPRHFRHDRYWREYRDDRAYRRDDDDRPRRHRRRQGGS